MWIATWALNTLAAKDKTADWMVHVIGQSAGAFTDATHGMTLSAVSMAYYRHICPYGLTKFKRFAVNVWGVSHDEKNDEQTAAEGLDRMEAYMREIGLMMSLKKLGVTEEMINGIAENSLIMNGGYKVLNKDKIAYILKKSM